MKRLRPVPLRDGLFVEFDEDGNVERTGFLVIGANDVVRFVDDWTLPTVIRDPAE